MKKIIAISSILLLVSGCASKVTTGERVFITPANSSHLTNCKMLGQVRVDAEIAGLFNVNEMVTEIKNRLRDKAADTYEDADTVTFSDLNAGGWGRPDSEAMGVAFKCFGLNS